jgi:hypothetical protein
MPKLDGFVFYFAVLLCIFPTAIHAFDLVCEVEYASVVTSLKPAASFDPYETTRIDLSGNFRFSAQHLLSSGKLKTFVYHYAKDRYVLLHAAEYRVNQAECSQYQQGFGLNKVYTTELEREFLFQCRSVCQ